MFDECWIGKGVDYRELWNDFEDGSGYIEKFQTREVHLFQLEFERHPANLPLFDHEAIYKTIKGCFHDSQASLSYRG
jgi:hypothetical protein